VVEEARAKRLINGGAGAGDETPIEAAADILVGAAKAEGSAIGTFKGIQLQASLDPTAEAIVADYNRRVTLLDPPASDGELPPRRD
jgi:hypothetical protein